MGQVDELLHGVDAVVVVDALRRRQVGLSSLVVAEVAVRRATDAQRLGRVGVGLERAVAVALGGIGLAKLEVHLGALGVQERGRHQLERRSEALDGLGRVRARAGGRSWPAA